ncbi:hypothetical protein [Chamaesiphon sp. OTE_20_metabat_361]|uniref:hypothetical protein n=1 Tax=Chamaesiphon sp. OTE_20_metabat_361 TaxID=2964689 RepID=UPI00286C1110|nr:hypothetical protein [Chamaesiphon sp. OTE_20_metabat_361]
MTIAATPSVNTAPLLLDVSNTTLTVTPAQFDRLVILEDPNSLDCSEVMPGFMLSMDRIW